MSRKNVPAGKVDQSKKFASLPVSGRTNVGNLAGATWKFLDEGFLVDHVAIGAGAVNQSAKAMATARNMASQAGYDLLVAPEFHQETVGGVNRTALRFFLVIAKREAAESK